MTTHPRIPWIGWAALITSAGGTYNPDPEAANGDPSPLTPCRCGARVGGLHLGVNGLICDLEWCSLCGGQALSCFCTHDKSEEETFGVHVLIPETDAERELLGAAGICIAPPDVHVRADPNMAGFPIVCFELDQLREIIGHLQEAEKNAT